jgi:hypothetical protein
MLQQLLFTTPLTTPVFSPSQIDFLALHLSKALSLATPEEIVHFRCPAREKDASEVQGYVAIFSPSNLLLTLKKNSFSPTHSKIENSRNPQSTTSLIFFHKEAFMKEKEIAPFMAIPPTFHGIVIDYQDFIPHHKNHSNQSSPHGTQIIHDPKKDVPPIRKESLNEQVRDLQRKIDQQAEEIRRLKQPVP